MKHIMIAAALAGLLVAHPVLSAPSGSGGAPRAQPHGSAYPHCRSGTRLKWVGGAWKCVASNQAEPMCGMDTHPVAHGNAAQGKQTWQCVRCPDGQMNIGSTYLWKLSATDGWVTNCKPNTALQVCYLNPGCGGGVWCYGPYDIGWKCADGSRPPGPILPASRRR